MPEQVKKNLCLPDMEGLIETVGTVDSECVRVRYIESSLVGETCAHCSKFAESAREPLITLHNPNSCTSGLAASG